MSEPITAATKAETPTDPCEPPESGQEVSVSAPPSLAYTVERLVDGEWLPFRRRVSAGEAWNYYVMAREGFSARVTMCEEELLVGDLAGLEAEYYARKLERAHPADVPALAERVERAVEQLGQLVVTPDQEAPLSAAWQKLREVATTARSRVSVRQTFVVESVETADTFAGAPVCEVVVRSVAPYVVDQRRVVGEVSCTGRSSGPQGTRLTFRAEGREVYVGGVWWEAFEAVWRSSWAALAESKWEVQQ